MKKPRRTRREFLWDASLVLAAAATAPFSLACNNTVAIEEPSETTSGNLSGSSWSTPRTRQAPDINLTPDLEKLAETVKSQYAKLKALAEDGTAQLRIAFPTGQGQEVLSLSLVAGGAARYRHVRIVKESNGDVANLLWSSDGIYPSIKFTDDRGRTIVQDGRPLEFSFRSVRREGRGPTSWLELGIKIAAIGLLVWLGASILKPIVAAIAFIAFNAMVIGIAIVGVALLVGIVRWILDVTGWTLEDVAALFRRTIAEFVQFLRDVVEAMGGR